MTRSRILVSALGSICSAALLSGCGIGPVDHSIGGTSALHGMVHGGQQPVSGAVIQLYTVGSSGNGSTATPMLTGTPVTTATDGTFDITGRYNCGQSSLGTAFNSPSNQVYIVATLGNPGFTPAVTNSKLVMMTALGDCANLPDATYVEINEITTAAAAWALAPFITTSSAFGVTATNVGSSPTNTLGITNAFLDAALLAESSIGLPTDLTSRPTLTVETPKLISLANALGGCVNSNGGIGCTPLLSAATPTGSLVQPADTLAAAINIVKNPGENVEAVFDSIGDRPPFTGGLATFPNDWTMSLTVTGGGMNIPTAMAIDSQSNVWVVSQNSPLTAFNAQGTLLSGSGYGVGVLDDSQGIAIDTHDDIWVTDYNAHFVTSGAAIKILGVNSSSIGTVVQNTQVSPSVPGFFADVYYPSAISADTNGNMFVSNVGKGATVLNSDGTLFSGYLGGVLSTFPNAIAVDANNGYWIPDGNYSVIHVTSAGDATTISCCDTSFGVATDAYNNVWVANEGDDTISAVQNDGTVLLNKVVGGGVENPVFVAVDAAQNVWFSNLFYSISEFAGKQNVLTAGGTPMSPSTGAHGTGGYGLDANMGEPNTIAPDRSGNIWVADQENNSITMFFGLATPTATPVQPTPTAP